MSAKINVDRCKHTGKDSAENRWILWKDYLRQSCPKEMTYHSRWSTLWMTSLFIFFCRLVRFMLTSLCVNFSLNAIIFLHFQFRFWNSSVLNYMYLLYIYIYICIYISAKLLVNIQDTKLIQEGGFLCELMMLACTVHINHLSCNSAQCY